MQQGTTLELYVSWLERFVADLELAPVVLVGNCIGSLSALHYTARHPQAVSALVLLHTLTTEVHQAGLGRLPDLPNRRLQGPLFHQSLRHLPRRNREQYLYARGQFGPIGDATGQAYLEHIRRCFADPTTRLDYFDPGPDEASWVLPQSSRLAGRPPICWTWGEANRLLPLDVGKRQLEVLEPEEVHILKDCGYAAAWEAPSRSTESSSGSLPATDVRPGPRRRWPQAMTSTRVLFVSGSIGLGHAARDLAIARELRQMNPGVEIVWLAGDPARRLIAEAGETLLAESDAFSAETVSAEDAAAGFSLNLMTYVRQAQRAWSRTVAAFAQATARYPYDLLIGDETYEIAGALARRPELRKAPFALIFDFVGLDAITRSPAERLMVWLWNRVWCGGYGGKPPGADLVLFVGEPQDVADRRFGLLLPNRRAYARRYYQFVGYILGFDPAACADTAKVRADLGYDQRPLVVCSVGGTAVGADLLRLCAAAYPHLQQRVADARMVLVCGPRVDPATIQVPPGVEVRGYLPRLYEHLAACDVAVVQGGGTTTLELTALRRPFVYFPLAGHFEQQGTVAQRLARHRAGQRLDYSTTTPEVLAATVAELLDRGATWPPIYRRRPAGRRAHQPACGPPR